MVAAEGLSPGTNLGSLLSTVRQELWQILNVCGFSSWVDCGLACLGQNLLVTLHSLSPFLALFTACGGPSLSRHSQTLGPKGYHAY